jgi:hypothetical protein
VEGEGIKEKYKRMILMKQKTKDRDFLLLDDDEAKDCSKNISAVSTAA